MIVKISQREQLLKSIRDHVTDDFMVNYRCGLRRFNLAGIRSIIALKHNLMIYMVKDLDLYYD